tara:strand:+ start:28837 stop:29022 length:186 start_codon:yes stop_codon:yes gene_type:complete
MKTVNLVLLFLVLAACEPIGKGYSFVHGWPKLPPAFILGQMDWPHDVGDIHFGMRIKKIVK